MSWPLDDLDTITPGDDRQPGHADEQTVFHNPRDVRKRMGQSLWVVNTAQRRIDDPVAAIRDKSVTVFAPTQR